MMESVKVNGIELAYERRGRGTPLVLLHGYPLDHSIWDALTERLDGEFDLILPDLRGFGKSTTVDTIYTMEDFAADIAGLLDHLGIQKTAIAGHSMGGYITLAFANRYPERIIGLGMISSQALADTPERREGRYKSAAEVRKNGIQGVVDAMTTKFTSNPEIQSMVRLVMQRQTPLAFIGALQAMAERRDASNVVNSFQHPIVLIHGTADELIPIDRARDIKNSSPHAHFFELDGVGHVPMLEEPQKTALALFHLK